MKESISIIFILFSCFFTLFAGGFSETKKFDLDNITNIEVDLSFENLTVSTSKGNQIVVISESNKKGVFPVITSENKILKIQATDSGVKREDKDSFCDISLMLPENYMAEKIVINAQYKKIDVKKLNVTIPAASSFTINANSYHSKFINNFTGTVDTWARDGITYKHNGGGTAIAIRSFDGDITVGEPVK